MNGLDQMSGAQRAPIGGGLSGVAGQRIPDAKITSPLQMSTSAAENNVELLRKRITELERVLQPLLVDPPTPGDMPPPANEDTARPSSAFVEWMRSHAREINAAKTQIESLIGRLQL